MATANDILVHSLETSQKLLNSYVADLTPQDYLHRTSPQANCAAWILGHLILSDHGALKGLGVANVPEPPAGFAQRFAREGEAPKAQDFGDVTALLPLFNQLRQRLIDHTRSMSEAEINKPLEKPHRLFSTVGQRINFMAFHVTMHAGQITLIRRSLGKPPLV